MTRRPVPLLFTLLSALLLTGCGTTYPEIRDYCERLGRPVTNEERIINALVLMFEADERLLSDFPPGTAPNRYPQSRNLPDNPGIVNPAPPYVPLHFMQFKRGFQQRERRAMGVTIATTYLRRFPTCCDVIDPFYIRANFGRDEMNTTHLNRPGLRWNRDVIIRQDPNDRNLPEDTDGYRKYDPDRFIDLSSDVCATTGSLTGFQGG